MSYITKEQKEKIKKFIEDNILVNIGKHDFDYNKVINAISSENYIDHKDAEEFLNFYIRKNDIKEVRYLTIPDEKIPFILEDMRKLEESIKKELKEGGL